ncbi:ArsR family transcriptional regulator [Altererythrobacter sp. B11]|uniref:winged helix-turn-helix transcriptional regulator n=1 Tax=Altererythrobacter sp. B11 TaxID=2060312 RepID=UPI000DC73B49|nr:helix-turn-helix domain-containing protein [Altererythrobacter sp. B11]BBC73869.1 ArsR family transcriptional regulator [Altererythrobacter sp. B11]
MSTLPFDQSAIARACEIAETPSPVEVDPRLERLVNELIGHVADKWTMLVLEVLDEHGELRFTQIARHVPDISQKMLTQTLRLMEREGLLVRTVHPVVPPKVEYRLTDLGQSLGNAFCGVWLWAEANMARIEQARAEFDRRQQAAKG